MFKLAIFSDEVSQDFQAAVNLCREYGLDGVEIRSVWDRPPQHIPDEDVKAMKAILAGTGVRVCGIASPFYKCEIDSEEDCRQHIAILERCIRLAQAFDCNTVRGFTFWRKGSAEHAWQKILDRFTEPIRILERTGACLAIENEASTFVGTGRALRRLLTDLGSERVKAIWDPCNCLYDEQGAEVPFPDGYEAIKDCMVHMHLKDAKRSGPHGKADCTPIGDGDLDIGGQLKALAADGYGGYVSLETHWRPVALTDAERERPGGAKFSESGEYASRLCLDRLFKMLSKIGIKR